jgi:hypothetical protein|tara:strand:+ start:1072 stop:1212 length:141 start_codon:yes stop_codon:yes gene_type:complete
MFILDIAEWIANLFILGIAACIWVVAIFGCMLIVVTIIDGYKKAKI